MVTEQPIECPELALIAAVLAQAVRDLAVKAERDRARRWIESGSERAFGFVWCCTTLGVDPQWARARISERKGPLLSKAR